MTDCTLVREELNNILQMTDKEIESCDSLIEYSVSCINPLIRTEDENDIRIVHLCAVKAYYQILLMQNEGVSSFSAGEVSFSADNSALAAAQKLLEEAMSSCSSLMTDSSFAFKAV